jgi:hypothetical protein
LIERLAQGVRGYALDVVTNTHAQTGQVSVHHFLPDGTQSVRETTLSWPPNLVSLGHVALPFPPDDAAYGLMPGSGRGGTPSIGSWLLRGENGAVTISLGSLTRPRSNPFWPLIDEDIDTLVAADRTRVER